MFVPLTKSSAASNKSSIASVLDLQLKPLFIESRQKYSKSRPIVARRSCWGGGPILGSGEAGELVPWAPSGGCCTTVIVSGGEGWTSGPPLLAVLHIQHLLLWRGNATYKRGNRRKKKKKNIKRQGNLIVKFWPTGHDWISSITLFQTSLKKKNVIGQ